MKVELSSVLLCVLCLITCYAAYVAYSLHAKLQPIVDAVNVLKPWIEWSTR
jgi:hypothetical protein